MSIFPNSNQVFYDLFNRAVDNATQMATLLNTAVNSTDTYEQKFQFTHIDKLKTKSYEITHQVFTESGRTLISPFQRKDMCELAAAIDDVADSIAMASRRINLYDVPKITPPIINLADLILQTTQALESAVKAMNNLGNSAHIFDICNSIKQLEYQADTVYNEAFADLLANETDAIQLIKYTDVFMAMETATDSCEDATLIIESILIKNG
ncbi:DUF47 domain-containing protein [Mucilaginibacter sp. OK283]|uniref:DUF47 domain-containing protein n=1 Tax=Mucilaginibacter sp. OK283 TaxID=1881049 RepID=UPI0008CB1A42|nr:DUF47 family protein [Mucilaginibacter sp. OK283]SEP02944.1 hypothetical protein SAMN05428947_10632 [Mucilaginibacter sp. OK283]